MKNDRLSIKIIRKVVFISIILISILTIGVVAGRINLNTVTIKFSDDSELSLVTFETNVGKILEDNYIIVKPDEIVTPSSESNIDFTKKIVIKKDTDESIEATEDVSSYSKEEILQNYLTITEKIITEQEEIPYETITKDISTSGTETKNNVVQEGENGIKELKYKVTYQNDIEIERVLISEEVIKEPVEKIIEISTKIVSRASSARTIVTPTASGEPTVVVFNASAYSADECGGNDLTASGAHATPYYTVATDPRYYPLGTVFYIPYFANYPNGGWFVSQDTGGIIKGDKIDIFMNNISECNAFGRRNIECYVYYQ